MKVELKITMDEKGQVGVGGPIQDKILCLGLLELAKTLVLEFKPEGARILAPDPATVVGLGRKAN